MQQVKVKLGVIVVSIVAASLLVGCDSAEEKRRKICSPVVLDINQARKGDDRIDFDAALKTAKAHGCSYKDVLPEEEKERADELIKNPIPVKKKELKQDGVDWSKPWHEKKHEW